MPDPTADALAWDELDGLTWDQADKLPWAWPIFGRCVAAQSHALSPAAAQSHALSPSSAQSYG